MASDYKKIAEDHEKRYGWDAKPRRIYKKLYSEKTHFIYELIQNADDSGSEYLKLRLDSNALLVWNDGRQFTEKDVRSICSLGSSDKDLTDIGTFGIGFKAVYNYTEFPEIYSDDEHFRIRDFIKPEGIDEITPEIEQLVHEGKTIFRLPFKDNPHHENDIEHLKNRLCNLLNEHSLLFLRCLKTFEWKDELNDQAGSYSSYRGPFDKIQNVPENQSVELVKLAMSIDDNNESSETFLVFCKKILPSKDVISELLEQAEDNDEEQRIQKSEDKLQPIEVAFKLQDDKITAMDDNCVLFAYLPTEKVTHLKFLIQARYQTTPPRDNIIKPSDSPWNRWLLEETADFFPEVLEHLKASGLLEPAFFNILPLKKDKVPKEFEFITEALQKAMREKAFIPTEKEGHYAKAEDVFYPDTISLQKLVKSSGMLSDSELLHPDIRKGTKEFGRCFDIMGEAGVTEIDENDLLCWLEKQSCNWFKNRTNKWLCSLYVYFNRKWNKSELERIKELPLVRLENGEHVCVSDQLVYFPPETDEDMEDIKPLLNDLRILKSTLLRKEGYNDIDIKAFLKNIGVKVLYPKNLISESICPLYRQPDKPSVMENRRHVRYIFQSWQKLAGFEHSRFEEVISAESERSRLEESVSEVPILRAYKGTQRETSDFVVPCKAYLPQAYTGDNDLETYFSVSDGAPWFVDNKYLTSKSDTKDWLQFLKKIRVMDRPRFTKEKISYSPEPVFDDFILERGRLRRFCQALEKREIEKENHSSREETIEDRDLIGLSEVLDNIRKNSTMKFTRALWHLLIKMVESLPSDERNRAFQGTYRWFYYSEQSKYFDATFYRQLKETAWIPDEPRDPRKPSECFAPTSENRELLGDIVSYLPDSFNTNSAAAKWLADKLEVRLNADADNVLNYLQTMSQKEVSVEDVEPIYKFLESEDVDLWRFEEEPLIFTSEPGPRWWRTNEVFWVNESPVFGDHCGYLADYYGDPLKEFFRGLGVRERAVPSDYIRVIRGVASAEVPEDSAVRERVQILYSSLWQSLREGGSSLEDEEWRVKWEQIREDKCWLGKKGDEWGFFCLDELVWKDDDYRSRLFKDEIPFWVFDDDLLKFAKYLDIKGCYQDSDAEFVPDGDQGEDRMWSDKVQNLYPYIYDFLNSPLLGGEYKEEKSAEILTQLLVRRVEKLEVKFGLKGISVPDPNPRQSFLEETVQEAILWLASEANENQYAWLIGDALQEYFGDVKELSGFVEDLLTKDTESVLTRWEQKGLQKNIGVPLPEEDSKENEKKSPGPGDEESSDETGNADDSGTNESENETPAGDEGSEDGDEDNGSTEDEPVINVYPLPPEDGDTEDDTYVEATDTSPHAKKEIERIGMEHARRYEEEQGRTVEDVSTQNLGFDLRSTTPNGEVRCIEVKARAERALVVLTSNEWDTAEKLKDTYFLYVVLNAKTQPELYILQNPADKVAVDEWYDVRYQVPLSEIAAHGKLV